MESIYIPLRLLHITAGSLCLLGGMTAMFSRKGGLLHRRMGIVYLWAMTAVCATALIMSTIKPNIFLFVIGVFSFHLAFSGWRWLKRKRVNDKPSVLDWTVHVLTAIATVGMWYLGITTMNIVVLVFALICTQGIIDDSRTFLNLSSTPPEKYPLRRILTHLGRMTGSLIAAWTALLVNNVHSEGFWFVPWLVPTVVGAGVIAWHTRKWRKKLLSATK